MQVWPALYSLPAMMRAAAVWAGKSGCTSAGDLPPNSSVTGVMASASRTSASTDSGSFVVAGLPGVNMSQDPIEYNSFTWHTNLDTYERIVPEDVASAATVVAAEVWFLADRKRTRLKSS